jgi:hypothetical protein
MLEIILYNSILKLLDRFSDVSVYQRYQVSILLQEFNNLLKTVLAVATKKVHLTELKNKMKAKNAFVRVFHLVGNLQTNHWD